MSYLSGNVFSNHFGQTLFWTFIHSFWQSALLTLLAGLILLCTRKSKPVIRYHLFSLLFLVFLAGCSVTFLYIWQKTAYTHKGALSLIATPLGKTTGTSLWKFLNDYAPLLTTVWFLVFLIKAIQMFRGFRAIYNISNLGIGMPNEEWKERFKVLSKRMNITKHVRFLESATLTIPATFGILKPVVLLPLGLLSNLPAEQIEAILLHELAHIKRKDFLVNSIQKFAEAIFFFNPFILWISKLIREERENCCDEMVLAQTEDRATMLHALISFEEYRHNPIRLAQYFTKPKGALLHRVRRIATQQNKTMNDVEKTLVILSFFLCMGLCFPLLRSTSTFSPYVKIADSKAATSTDGKTPISKENRKLVVLHGIIIESTNLSSNQDTLKVASAITKDLIANGIVENEKTLSYKLDDKELIVNGIKQPVALHLMLKRKYVSEQGWSVFYNLYHREYPRELRAAT